MTKNEINAAISKARGHKWISHNTTYGPILVCAKCDSINCHAATGTRDYTSDAHWPRLLREMPSPGLTKLGSRWGCSYMLELGAVAPVFSISDDIGVSVCKTWLKWKGIATGYDYDMDT